MALYPVARPPSVDAQRLASAARDLWLVAEDLPGWQAYSTLIDALREKGHTRRAAAYAIYCAIEAGGFRTFPRKSAAIREVLDRMPDGRHVWTGKAEVVQERREPQGNPELMEFRAELKTLESWARDLEFEALTKPEPEP